MGKPFFNQLSSTENAFKITSLVSIKTLVKRYSKHTSFHTQGSMTMGKFLRSGISGAEGMRVLLGTAVVKRSTERLHRCVSPPTQTFRAEPASSQSPSGASFPPKFKFTFLRDHVIVHVGLYLLVRVLQRNRTRRVYIDTHERGFTRGIESRCYGS